MPKNCHKNAIIIINYKKKKISKIKAYVQGNYKKNIKKV